MSMRIVSVLSTLHAGHVEAFHNVLKNRFLRKKKNRKVVSLVRVLLKVEDHYFHAMSRYLRYIIFILSLIIMFAGGSMGLSYAL